MKKLPSTAFLRQQLDYNPNTGELLWKIRVKGRRLGRRAGCLTTLGYRAIYLAGTSYKEHRVIWKLVTGKEPKGEIDHKNCDKANNAWCNLRESNTRQNRYNTRRPAHNTSGFKGVSWNVRDKKWQAHIRLPGKQKHVGYFDSPKEAHVAYINAAKKHFGEFARAK